MRERERLQRSYQRSQYYVIWRLGPRVYFLNVIAELVSAAGIMYEGIPISLALCPEGRANSYLTFQLIKGM